MLNPQTLLLIVAVILVVLLVVAIFLRLIRIAIALGVIIILVPILCTIMWGDGTDYVSKIASIFTPEIEENINDGYQEYRDKNAEDPVVDMDQLEEYFNQAGKAAGDALHKPVFPQR